MQQETTAVPISEAFLQVLRTHGVEYIFCSPGSDWGPVWEALARRRAEEEPLPHYVNCRHEELAVTMAAGYAKVTGRLPAVLLHTTTGTLHGALSMRGAYHENTPMLIAAGEPTGFGEDPGPDPGGHWLAGLSDVGGPGRGVEPFMKWSSLAPTVETFPGKVHHACRIALTEPQGPVYLSIPVELLLRDVSRDLIPQDSRSGGRSFPDPAIVDRVAKLLVESQAPLIITERAGREPATVARLVALAEQLAIPVVEEHGPLYLNFPRTHPLHIGYTAGSYLQEADVVVLLGARAPWHPPSRGPRPGATVIVADEDPSVRHLPYWSYPEHISIPGSLSVTVEQLQSRVEALARGSAGLEARVSQRLRRWTDAHERRRNEWMRLAQACPEARPLDIHWVGQEIGARLPDEAIVVEETTSTRPILTELVPRSQPGTYFSGHYGGLGAGMGLALGIKLALPERLVTLFIGDGAFNYNPVLAGLGLMQEYRLPLLIIVFDNGGYTSMKSRHLSYYPDGWAVKTGIYYGSEITPGPDYGALARVFGAHGERIEDPAELRPALARALQEVQAGRPALLDLVIDPADRRRRSS